MIPAWVLLLAGLAFAGVLAPLWLAQRREWARHTAHVRLLGAGTVRRYFADMHAQLEREIEE